MAKTTGFVGLGTMGKPMASNLLKAGFQVTICGHKNTAPIKELQAEGAVVVETPSQVAAASDVVVTCLPDSPEVTQVVAGENGLLAGSNPGMVIIDTSTINPKNAQALAEKAQEKGCVFLDAPMSGGEVGAIAGALTFMIGGDKAAVDACEDVFNAMGKKTYYAGEAGSGQVVKLCNNLMLGINLVGVCEAFAMGVKAGVEAQTLAEIVQASSGGSAVIERYFPKTIAKNQYKPGFRLKLMSKDMNLALDAAKQLGIPSLAGVTAGQVFDMVMNMGRGDDDFAVVATFYQDIGNVIIGTPDEPANE
ncbi:NAD(P)-dependent oxidoreductase [bacterium]|nr:NAD(P)-dependent oxidoreductase [bacterium]